MPVSAGTLVAEIGRHVNQHGHHVRRSVATSPSHGVFDARLQMTDVLAVCSDGRMMILSGMMFVAGGRLREPPIAGVDHLTFNVEAIVYHRVLFDEVWSSAHVEDGDVWPQSVIHSLMFPSRTDVLHHSHAVQRSQELVAESTKIFDVDAGHEVCLGALERHHTTVMFIEAITYGAADVMRTRF